MSYFLILLFVIIIVFSFKKRGFLSINTGNSYHNRGGSSYKNLNCFFEKGGKDIDYKNLEYYRDIPQNGDIFRSFWYIYNYNLGKRDDDFLAAVFLKWIKDGNIEIKIDDNGNKYIHIVDKPMNCNEIEEKFYHYMFQASFGNSEKGFSIDNLLDVQELKNWYHINHGKISEFFCSVLDYEVDNLVKEGKIIVEKYNKNGNYGLRYNVDSSLKEEFIKLAGLKKYFEDFTILSDKEELQVKLFDDYLIYATMFGITNVIYDNFKEFYPEFSNIYSYMDNEISVIEIIFK